MKIDTRYKYMVDAGTIFNSLVNKYFLEKREEFGKDCPILNCDLEPKNTCNKNRFKFLNYSPILKMPLTHYFLISSLRRDKSLDVDIFSKGCGRKVKI